jgi:ABC-type polysaccharide/polyol phosphate transport system ATPase subunit
MQLRLAYSIAIQVDFDILMLDEVLAVGDQEFQQRCFESLATIRAAGRTIVFVSHDLEAVKEHCNRAMLLFDGRIRAIGDPEDVMTRYGELARSDG